MNTQLNEELGSLASDDMLIENQELRYRLSCSETYLNKLIKQGNNHVF